MCSSTPDPEMWIIQGTLAWRSSPDDRWGNSGEIQLGLALASLGVNTADLAPEAEERSVEEIERARPRCTIQTACFKNYFSIENAKMIWVSILKESGYSRSRHLFIMHELMGRKESICALLVFIHHSHSFMDTWYLKRTTHHDTTRSTLHHKHHNHQNPQAPPISIDSQAPIYTASTNPHAAATMATMMKSPLQSTIH
ncbi:uncharacterized protein CFP56_020311 [Quercus suber]|uniref:Uncharacterized protein n=1 Tax=Quercus suber TaxID=58331 RepID=A0AAW0KFC4_QUESU